MKPVIGKWYALKYSSDTYIGLCTDIFEYEAFLSYRWVSLFRSRHLIPFNSIIGEVDDPRIITKLLRILNV